MDAPAPSKLRLRHRQARRETEIWDGGSTAGLWDVPGRLWSLRHRPCSWASDLFVVAFVQVGLRGAESDARLLKREVSCYVCQ